MESSHPPAYRLASGVSLEETEKPVQVIYDEVTPGMDLGKRCFF